jgi:hypothetical protein
MAAPDGISTEARPPNATPQMVSGLMLEDPAVVTLLSNGSGRGRATVILVRERTDLPYSLDTRSLTQLAPSETRKVCRRVVPTNVASSVQWD